MNNLAFVVLNYNSADDTIRCVERLLSFNKNFWIIIVDNFSSDDSQERISKQFQSKKKLFCCLLKKIEGMQLAIILE